MSSGIVIKKLSQENFHDYESLTKCAGNGGCYCSFWHQKWNSMKDWETQQSEHPEWNRSIVLEKMRSGFHMGVLAYKEEKLVAWVSVGPLIDFHWTWRRIIQVGESAKSIAGITCFTVASEFRGQGMQVAVLEAMKDYGRSQKWLAIEGYPFDQSAVDRYGKEVVWPGLTSGFIAAGFVHLIDHWLSNPESERSVYRFDL